MKKIIFIALIFSLQELVMADDLKPGLDTAAAAKTADMVQARNDFQAFCKTAKTVDELVQKLKDWDAKNKEREYLIRAKRLYEVNK